MNKDSFYSYISNASLINDQASKSLQHIVEQYPYFQTARLLFLKSLYDNQNIAYTQELKITACYAGNRSLLQKLITQKPVESVETEYVEPISLMEETPIGEIQKVPISEPEITKPDETEIDFSFIMLEDEKPKPKVEPIIEPHKEQQNDAEINTKASNIHSSLINKFLELDPVFKAKTPEPVTPNLAEGCDTEPELMTETLAEIYIKQKKYDKAIHMFQKLSLKFPQKSIYFATRISDINNIINNDKK